MKQEIDLYQLKDACIETFRHYWGNDSIGDYDVFVGIREYFAENLWRCLQGYDPKGDNTEFSKKPKKCRHQRELDERIDEIKKDVENNYLHIIGSIYIKRSPSK